MYGKQINKTYKNDNKKYICKICKIEFIHNVNYTLHCELNHKNESPLYRIFNIGNMCTSCND